MCLAVGEEGIREGGEGGECGLLQGVKRLQWAGDESGSGGDVQVGMFASDLSGRRSFEFDPRRGRSY